MIFILATNIFAIEKSSYTDATQTRQGKTYEWKNWCGEWEKINCHYQGRDRGFCR